MKDKKITVEKVGKVPGKLGGLSLNEDFVNEIKEHLETVPSLVGARGPHGASGEQGRRGRRGLKGETGTGGMDGDHGVDGAVGDDGVKGDDGEIGLSGRQGEIGAQGSKGNKGDKGDKGEPGEKGKQGRTGPGGGRAGAGRSAATTDFSSISLVGTDLVFARDKAGPLGPSITVDLSSLAGQAGQSGFVGLGPWRLQTEIVSPPATGQVRFNNVDPESATELFLHETNSNGEDLASFLVLLEAGDLLYIQNAGDSSQFILCEISSNTDSGVFVTLGLANVAQQGGAIAQDTSVNIIATIAGGGGGGANVVNDAVQARRTTIFTLTTAFVDVTLDVTDVETDAAIIEHDNVNTDNIDIKVTGTYEITYEADILTNATSNATVNADGRVRLNDLGTGINGSLGLSCAFRDSMITGNDFNSHLSVTFIANLTAGDFITLQLQKTEIGGSDVFVADEVHLQAKRLVTIAGGGGGNVTKVDTPVDNQIGVWTGDGTLEGDSNLIWTGTVFEVGGTIQVFNTSGPALLNEVSSNINPTLVPNKQAPSSGLGGIAGQPSLIANGKSGMSVNESGGAAQIGFYDRSPVAKQTGVSVTTAAIHAALVSLGLIAA